MSRLSKPLKSMSLRVKCRHAHRLDRGGCLRRRGRRLVLSVWAQSSVRGEALDTVVMMFSASVESYPRATVYKNVQNDFC